jgi:hypothetical protein
MRVPHGNPIPRDPPIDLHRATRGLHERTLILVIALVPARQADYRDSFPCHAIPYDECMQECY